MQIVQLRKKKKEKKFVAKKKVQSTWIVMLVMNNSTSTWSNESVPINVKMSAHYNEITVPTNWNESHQWHTGSNV